MRVLIKKQTKKQTLIWLLVPEPSWSKWTWVQGQALTR